MIFLTPVIPAIDEFPAVARQMHGSGRSRTPCGGNTSLVEAQFLPLSATENPGGVWLPKPRLSPVCVYSGPSPGLAVEASWRVTKPS